MASAAIGAGGVVHYGQLFASRGLKRNSKFGRLLPCACLLLWPVLYPPNFAGGWYPIPVST